MTTTANTDKPFRVLVTKPDGKRRVEFNTYVTFAQAEVDARALRSYGIDAQVSSIEVST
jgi:hypothetical protein